MINKISNNSGSKEVIRNNGHNQKAAKPFSEENVANGTFQFFVVFTER